MKHIDVSVYPVYKNGDLLYYKITAMYKRIAVSRCYRVHRDNKRVALTCARIGALTLHHVQQQARDEHWPTQLWVTYAHQHLDVVDTLHIKHLVEEVTLPARVVQEVLDLGHGLFKDTVKYLNSLSTDEKEETVQILIGRYGYNISFILYPVHVGGGNTEIGIIFTEQL